MGIFSWIAQCFVSPSAKQKSQVLNNTPSFDEVCARLKRGEYKNIILLTGAGVSVASGIPDFRSKTGIYEVSKKFSLPYAFAVFDLNFFKRNPLPFYHIVRSIVLRRNPTNGMLERASYPPSLAHCFFRLLEEKNLLLRLYTQNVDCLDLIAGVSSSRLVQVHGTMAGAKCLECGSKVSVRHIGKSLLAVPPREEEKDESSTPSPRCPRCNSIFVKPKVVLFGESIAPSFAKSIVDMPRCDLLLCFGSSFQVVPFASLVTMVSETTPRVLFNLEMTGASEFTGPLASSGKRRTPCGRPFVELVLNRTVSPALELYSNTFFISLFPNRM